MSGSLQTLTGKSCLLFEFHHLVMVVLRTLPGSVRPGFLLRRARANFPHFASYTKSWPIIPVCAKKNSAHFSEP